MTFTILQSAVGKAASLGIVLPMDLFFSQKYHNATNIWNVPPQLQYVAELEALTGKEAGVISQCLAFPSWFYNQLL